MKIELGKTYKDRITDFQGVATGRVQYISGCNQALLAPKAKPDGSVNDAMWYDEQRLELVDAPRIKLDNGPTPGHDLAAPKR